MKLFLDDNRTPDEVVGDFYEQDGWVIVANYHEFVSFVMEEGVPEIVSFGHDLAEEHYEIDWWDVYELGVKPVTSEPTGLECLRWLLNFCADSKVSLPVMLCHSMNPVGREQIQKLIK